MKISNLQYIIGYISYAAGLSSGALAGWKAMFWNAIGFDICFEIPNENAAICSWMYIRNVSEDHLPIFLMVLWSTLFRCIVIAPPALRLWLPTYCGNKPCWFRFNVSTVFFFCDCFVDLWCCDTVSLWASCCENCSNNHFLIVCVP